MGSFGIKKKQLHDCFSFADKLLRLIEFTLMFIGHKCGQYVNRSQLFAH